MSETSELRVVYRNEGKRNFFANKNNINDVPRKYRPSYLSGWNASKMAQKERIDKAIENQEQKNSCTSCGEYPLKGV